MATAFYIIIDYVKTCFHMGTIMAGVIDTGCALNSIDRSKFKEVDEARP